MITIFYFLLIFIFESAALIDREKAFFAYIILPAIYYLEKEFKKEIIKNLNWAFFSYLTFLFFAFFSFLKSVDKINSLDNFLFLLGAYFVFLIGLNEEKFLLTYLKKILIIGSFLFSTLSLLPKELFKITALQLIYPLYPNHNHLGDFLGLTLIFLINDFLNKKNKIDLILMIFFLPFFIFSFSRSAYIDLLIILIFLFLGLKKDFIDKKDKKFLLVLSFIIFLFFIFTQQEIYQFKLFSPLYQLFTEKFNFIPRSFFASRPEYFWQAWQGFLEKPFFGWGVGNFFYLSKKYVSQNLQQVFSALNFPLTILAEIGIFGFIFFLIFLIVIFKNIDHKKKPYNFLFYYLCLNFLTDYTYAIYGLFLFCFLLAGLIQKKQEEKNFFIYPLFSILVLIFIFLKLTGQIFLLIGAPQIAAHLFPLDHLTFQKLILKMTNEGKFNLAKKYINDYENNSFYSYETLTFLGDFFEKQKDEKKALKYYQRLTDNDRFPSFTILKKVYQLKKQNQGKNVADNYFSLFFKNFKNTFWLNSQFENEVYQFCFQENIPICRFRRFYQPKPKTKEKNDNLPIKVSYIFNNEGFNERFDYLVKKPKDTYRILVLGDSIAFGFLVKTNDNWAEKLEDKLKSFSQEKTLIWRRDSKLTNVSTKDFQVINLSYHSDDLAYAIERYKNQGKKYQPDLIIFMNNNFYRINELFLPLTEKYYYLEKVKSEKEKLKKQGKFFPAWDLAWEEYLKKVNDKEIYQRQRQYLDEFFSSYQGKVLFISLYDIPQEIKNYLKEKKQVKIYEILDFPENKNYYYQELPNIISPKGHEELSKRIFNFLKDWIF